jgi:hypothetical protein
MRICGADAGDGGSRGRQARRESARAAESARGESCSLSLSLSLASARGGAARGARERRGGARACHRPPDATDTHLTHTRDRESGASEHSLSHRDYKVFKRNYNRKKSMLRQNRESSRGESPRRTPTRRHLDLPTPARARHTAPARAPADGLWGHNRSARRPPRYAAPHQLTTGAVAGARISIPLYKLHAIGHVACGCATTH